MVQLGWKAGPEQYAPVDLLNYAVAAEQAGFELMEVSDHFHPWSEAGQAAFTWTWLGAAASRTNRIVLGPGVTCPILRYHPTIIAQAAATLSHFAPNRTILGLGTGEALNEFAATGAWPSYSQRRDRLAEAIDIIRGLLNGETLSYDGEFYQTCKAKLYTPPTSKIPLILSALSPHGGLFAGRYGDGLITTGGKKPEIYQELLKNFEESARAVGKDPRAMPTLVELSVAYTSDIDAAIQEQLKYWAGTYVPALFNQNVYTPAMSAENGEIVGADIVKKTGCFSPNPDDHVKFAQQYVDLGFSCLVFHSPGPDQRAFLEGYGRDVLPRLRSLSKQPVSVGQRTTQP
ncbi:MAG: TIGR03557 family F420-dependent LLM class oxidoreductase [Ktedonobacteraceae bacterium]|nr:TIGR03557 family F420-dependent LLM class oxidoreductase [Ktedonobacteraceae bacterium]